MINKKIQKGFNVVSTYHLSNERLLSIIYITFFCVKKKEIETLAKTKVQLIIYWVFFGLSKYFLFINISTKFYVPA